MDLRLGDELALLDATATAFCARVAEARSVERDPRDERRTLAKMAELGWTGLASKDPGERLALGVVVEALGRAALPSPFRESTGSCGTLLAVLPGAGNGSSTSELASALASGRAVGSLLEVGGAASARWRARGDGAVVDVAETVLDWGQLADHVVCVARDDEGRRAVLAVEVSARGVSVTPVAAVDDERPALLRLEGAPARLLEPASGQLDDALADARALRLVLRSAELLGAADAALAMTVAYVKDRHQFGRPIASFQAVRHACADVATAVEGLRLAVHEALWRASAGLPFRRQAAGAVLFGARTSELAATWSSELHGGVGFMADYPLERFVRRLKAGQVRLGSPSELSSWAAPFLLTPALDRSPFPQADIERLRGLRTGGAA